MQQTVVGVFDSMSEAHAAVNALTATGLSRDRVQLTESSNTQASAEARMTAPDEGMLSSIKHFFSGLFGDDDTHQSAPYAEAVRRGGAIVKVNVDSDDELDRATEALDDAGAVDIEERANSWRAEGWQPGAVPAGATASSVSSTGTSEPEALAPSLNLTQARSQSQLSGTRMGSVGALRVFDRQVDDGGSTLGDADYEHRSSGYRNDFQEKYGVTGAYSDYEPAYRFGDTLRSDDRYAGRHWDNIEPDVRRDWEEKNPGSAWDKFKGAIRHAWDKATA